MSIEVFGLDALETMIRQGGARAQHGVVDQMRKEAENMRDLAKKFAPIDEGNLEDAIEMEERGGGRDDMGRFARKSFVVKVNLRHAAPHGKTVGDYAYLMHEHLTPYGPLNLGPLSQAKQEGQSEMVGGMYMERAVDQVTLNMMKRLIDAARVNLG